MRSLAYVLPLTYALSLLTYILCGRELSWVAVLGFCITKVREHLSWRPLSTLDFARDVVEHKDASQHVGLLAHIYDKQATMIIITNAVTIRPLSFGMETRFILLLDAMATSVGLCYLRIEYKSLRILSCRKH